MTDTAAWLKPGFEAELDTPQDLSTPKRQCSTVKRDGERCGALAMRDGLVCAMHSPRGKEIRSKAVQASVKARQDKVEARNEAKEQAKLTLTERLSRDAGARADELVSALIQRAVDGDMRAQGIVWERLEGKVTDHLVTTTGDTFEMDMSQLNAWLHTMSEPSTTPQPEQ